MEVDIPFIIAGILFILVTLGVSVTFAYFCTRDNWKGGTRK